MTFTGTLKRQLPWSLRGLNPFLSAYGDSMLFRGIRRTPRLQTNPSSDTGIHSAVPHRYLLAYLVAIKSFLHHQPDIAVFVHDDGSLTEEDKVLIRSHIGGVRIVDRAEAIASSRIRSRIRSWQRSEEAIPATLSSSTLP